MKKNFRGFPVKDYDEAMTTATREIARASKANEVMIAATAAGLREDGEIERERGIATLITSANKAIHPEDILLMWAVLIMERAESSPG